MSDYQSITISKETGERAKKAADEFNYRSLADLTEKALNDTIERLEGEAEERELLEEEKRRRESFVKERSDLKSKLKRGEVSEKEYLEGLANLAEKYFPSKPGIEIPTSQEERPVEEDARGNPEGELDPISGKGAEAIVEKEIPGIDFDELIRDKLPEELRETLESHISSCPECTDLWTAVRNFALHWHYFHVEGGKALAEEDFYDDVIEGKLWPLPKCIYCLLADFVVERGVLEELWEDKDGVDYHLGIGMAISIILLETGMAFGRNPDILKFALKKDKLSRCSLLSLLSGGQALASFCSHLEEELGDLESEKAERELEEKSEEFLGKLGDKMREYTVPADVISKLEDFCDGPVNQRLDEIKTRESESVSSASEERRNKDQ